MNPVALIDSLAPIIARTIVLLVLSLVLQSDLSKAQELETESATKIAVDDGAALFRIRELITAGQHEEAVDSLIDIMQRADLSDRNGQRTFVGVSDSTIGETDYQLYLPLRIGCQLELCRWHDAAPQALELYRKRTDLLAKQEYDAAIEEESMELLQKNVARWFPGSFADEALLTLGDYHLEAARFYQARECWERILPVFELQIDSRSGKEQAKTVDTISATRIRTLPLWLAAQSDEFDADKIAKGNPSTLGRFAYPDTDIPHADVAARMVIASIVEGSFDRAHAELKIFAALFPNARGKISGKTVDLNEELNRLLGEAETVTSSVVSSTAADWKTFAGSPTRNAKAIGNPDPSGRPIWSVDVEVLSTITDVAGLGKPRVAETKFGFLSYHPVVIDNTAIWHDSTTVRAIDLHTGLPKWPYDELVDGDPETRGQIWQPALTEEYKSLFRPRLGGERFTSFVDGDRYFARMGNPLTGIQDDEPRKNSFLIGLDLSKQGKLLPGFPLEPPGERFQFEGSPIVSGSRLYIAVRETTARSSRVTLHLACYELPGLKFSPACRQLWQTPICIADSPAGGKLDESTHVLLTQVEQTIYCNTNLGAIAAIDSGDGQVEWISKYRREDFQTARPTESTDHAFRELNPPVFDRGLLFVAPSDSKEIFAIDADTGNLLWNCQANSVSQILGTTDTHLIVAGIGIHWLNLSTGTEVAAFPTPGMYSSPIHAWKSPSGLGRGIITTDAIYWPTHEKIFVFNHQLIKTTTATGSVSHFPQQRQEIDLVMRGLGGGNLFVCGDYLIIASEDRISAFNSTGKNHRE